MRASSKQAAYSIHMHVWTQAEFLRLILDCRERFGDGFDLEASAQQGIEFMVVLRKRGAMPPPNQPASPAQPQAGIGTRIRSKLKRTLGAGQGRG